MSDEWMEENMAVWPSNYDTGEDDHPAEKHRSFLFDAARRRGSVNKAKGTILKNPFVPLVFRLITATFTLAALGLGARVYRETSDLSMSADGGCVQRASTYIAIVVDTIAVPYIIYVTLDEYTSKPLGLRSATAKTALLLIDLYFIIRLETLQQPEGYPHKHSQHNSRLRDVPHLSCDYPKRIFNRKSFNDNDDDDIGLNSIYRTDASVLMRQLRRWHNDRKVILRIHLADLNLSDRLNYEKPLPTSFGVRGRLTARKSAAPILNRHDTIRYRWLLHHNASFGDSNILLVWEAAIWPDPNTAGSKPATYRQRAAFRDAGWELLREIEVETPAAGQSSDGPEDMEQKLRITIARQDRPGGPKSRLPPFSKSLDRLAMEADRDIECGECPACKRLKVALDDEEE
ncbi:Regulator of phospholipase D SRF1 [Elsinoe australis]|uniref:Regulator of phospholipase D SRF1 n=1 Tax=Elsinoe australis TaxID=40998 RepID=A0A2P8AIN5_9PEZI|nr:Regulator of phospholipase D SRF1 [Elsinoe australis]